MVSPSIIYLPPMPNPNTRPTDHSCSFHIGWFVFNKNSNCWRPTSRSQGESVCAPPIRNVSILICLLYSTKRSKPNTSIQNHKDTLHDSEHRASVSLINSCRIKLSSKHSKACSPCHLAWRWCSIIYLSIYLSTSTLHWTPCMNEVGHSYLHLLTQKRC